MLPGSTIEERLLVCMYLVVMASTVILPHEKALSHDSNEELGFLQNLCFLTHHFEHRFSYGHFAGASVG